MPLTKIFIFYSFLILSAYAYEPITLKEFNKYVGFYKYYEIKDGTKQGIQYSYPRSIENKNLNTVLQIKYIKNEGISFKASGNSNKYVHHILYRESKNLGGKNLELKFNVSEFSLDRELYELVPYFNVLDRKNGYKQRSYKDIKVKRTGEFSLSFETPEQSGERYIYQYGFELRGPLSLDNYSKQVLISNIELLSNNQKIDPGFLIQNKTLLLKTFFIVGMMLLVTTITAKINHAFETRKEQIITILSMFALLFAIMIAADIFPLNIIVCCIFSGVVGWMTGPQIAAIGKTFRWNKYLKDNFIKIDSENNTFTRKLEQENINIKDAASKFIPTKEETHSMMSDEYRKIEEDFNSLLGTASFKEYSKQWEDTVFQAFILTFITVLSTGIIVFLSPIDFSFLGLFLFIALGTLIVLSLLNAYVFKQKISRVTLSWFGVILFTLYLIYDFNALEKSYLQGDQSWRTAVHIAVNLYIDIINLFLDILEILSAE